MRLSINALRHSATEWVMLLAAILLNQSMNAQTSKNYRLKNFDYPVTVYQWDYNRAHGTYLGLNWSTSTFDQNLGEGDEGLFNGPGLVLNKLFKGGHTIDAQASYNFGSLSHYPAADRISSRLNGQITVAKRTREKRQTLGPLNYAQLPENKKISGISIRDIEVNVMTMIQASGGLSYHPMQYGTRNVLAHTGIVWSQGTATYVEVNGEGFPARALTKSFKVNLLWYPNISTMKFPGLEFAYGLQSFIFQHPIVKRAWYRNVFSPEQGEVFIGYSPFTNTGPNGRTQVHFLFGFRSRLMNIGSGYID